MNLRSYRNLFITVTLVLVVVAASPVLAAVISFPDGSEPFTELWILDSGHTTENYPFNVSVGGVYKVFVDVANRMGGPEFYLLQVKFCNVSQYVMEVGDSEPSSLESLYDFYFFLGDENVWESGVTFGFQDVSFGEDTVAVGSVVVDGVVFPVDASALWDSEAGVFYFHLFFELWRYDTALQGFQFDHRSVGVWVNMTAPL